MPSGYCSLGGQVLNPYTAADQRLPERRARPGSAAAPRRRLDGDHDRHARPGSITSRRAAAATGVGLRPTIGLVSRTGIVPISATQDTAGPITRTVADAAAELGDRRQGPGGPGDGDRARDRARTTSPALTPTRWPASGSA